MRRTLHIALLSMLLPCMAVGQRSARHPIVGTVSDLPTCNLRWDGRIVSITDGASATDCATGAGSTVVLCICDNGSGWASVDSGGITPAGSQYDVQANDGSSGLQVAGGFATNASSNNLAEDAANTVVLGNLSTSDDAYNIAIGYDIEADSQQVISIGKGMTNATDAYDDNVCVGSRVDNLCQGLRNVHIGWDADFAGNDNVVIGDSALAATGQSVVIGSGAGYHLSGGTQTVVGFEATWDASVDYCRAFGKGATCDSDYQFTFSEGTGRVEEVCMGPQGCEIQNTSDYDTHYIASALPSGVWNNMANPKDIYWDVAVGTGTAASGNFYWQYAPPAGATSNNAHTLTTGMRYQGKSGHLGHNDQGVAINSCGTGATVSGHDMGGKITVGTGTITTCVIDFAYTWNNAPPCSVIGDDSSIGLAATTSTTQLTVTAASAIDSDVLMYTCVGHF